LIEISEDVMDLGNYLKQREFFVKYQIINIIISIIFIVNQLKNLFKKSIRVMAFLEIKENINIKELIYISNLII
jgi:hypothetical protein